VPGRSRGAVIQRAHALGLSRRSVWTIRETEALRALWLQASPGELTEACGRHSWPSISKKASDLGLRRRHSRREAKLKVLRDLREFREKNRLTIKHVAARAGYHWNQITVWENGKAVPTLQAVADWALALGFDVVLRARPGAVKAFDPTRAMSRTGQGHARAAHQGALAHEATK
jgi:transcriptional regulator with XRE-family HTH domain